MKKPEIEMRDLLSISPSDINPRTITEGNFNKLIKSIQEFPEMLNLRPIIVDKAGKIIAGNMRYRACIKLGMTTAPVVEIDWTNEKLRKLMLLDNHHEGEWDEEVLKNFWSQNPLQEWGLTNFSFGQVDKIPDPEPPPSEYDDEIEIVCPYCAETFTIKESELA